ncbi:hypothetical protein [uncultured Cellulomonas sp.]|uniref:hypothetical protein n=1 Tax=uncultured Cellulomonas sp. TaxID=189682 RepID=UPI00261736CF|nr:hypothetical protein [uncultured Cellulomonas sp.]
MSLPYREVEFEKDGTVHDSAQVDAVLGMLDDERATDVLLMIHGWNNDMPAARRMYDALADSIDAARPHVAAARTRRIAVVGVLWPSIRWADDVAGGGVGLADGETRLRADIADRVEDTTAAARLEDLVPRLETDPEARREYLRVLRDLLPPADLVDDDDAVPTALRDRAADADVAFDLAGSATDLENAPELGGGAAGFSLGGFLDGARKLLNTVTYYAMKARAGTVGTRGVASLLETIVTETGRRGQHVRVHLLGHSFGARVAAAAAAHTGATVHSVSLLQGAFSHYGFAEDWDGAGGRGLFQAVPARLSGPLLVTHTRNDTAIGLAYAIASRLANQVAAGLGDADDVYGGIGRNGALKSSAARGPGGTLGAVGASYDFAPRTITNLRSDEFIADHSAVTGREVGYAVLSAVVTG